MVRLGKLGRPLYKIILMLCMIFTSFILFWAKKLRCPIDCEHKALCGFWCRHKNPTVTPFPGNCPRYVKKHLNWWDF